MRSLFLLLLSLVLPVLAEEMPLSLTLQSRSPSNQAKLTKEAWLPSRTAIIVCDMWDLHHCKNAVVREGEMAPRMNEVLEKARAQGVLIIHAPSSCMKPYEGTPARERAKTAPPAARLPDKEWVDDQAYWFQLKFDTNQSKASWALILRNGHLSVFMPELAKLQLKQRLLIAVRKDSL